ncbi:hypothetical protein [uncultured Clostridium sp.]|uniref:hypothetical protein n=1 Tax=uncultured Clostridium sp. TaxID=59620 RepID=UPI002620A9DA|nr:hypothetical protein [uncultured Clostridium sp.]
MTDQEYIEYMELHYIKNNENRFDIMKDLRVTEYQFYKRNKELGIFRNSKNVEKKSDTKLYKFDLIKQIWVKR